MPESDTELQFFKDSLKLYDFSGKYFGKWKSDNSRIYIELLKWDDSIEISRQFELEYKLAHDSLFIKREYDSSFVFPVMLKFKNRFKQWQRVLGIEIELQKSEEIIKLDNESMLNIVIYIGFRNNKLVAKIRDRFINLQKKDALKAAFYRMVAQSEERKFSDINYVLVMDKNITEYQTDSIKSILLESPIKNIFRVYKNDTIDYHDLNWRNTIQWYGKYEFK